MSVTEYKIDPDYLRGKLAELQSQVGDKPLLPVFVEQTRRVLAKGQGNYLRYGPYWWAIKRILHANGVDVGIYDEPIWADEYTGGSPELTLLAAWEFAEDNMSPYGVLTNEYEIDGRTFLLYDADQAEAK